MIDNIEVDIYGRNVAFLVEVTPEEFDRFYYDNVTRITDEEYQRIKKDILNKSIGGFTRLLNSGMSLVYLKNGRSDIFVPHKIFHVCNDILCRAGVHHDIDAEAWAYLIGWMTNEYYRKYWAWTDSKKENKK